MEVVELKLSNSLTKAVKRRDNIPSERVVFEQLVSVVQPLVFDRYVNHSRTGHLGVLSEHARTTLLLKNLSLLIIYNFSFEIIKACQRVTSDLC